MSYISISYTYRNATVVLASLGTALILFITGFSLRHRECQNSALPINWQSDLTYQHPFHPDTIPFGLTFIEAVILFPLIAVKAMTQSGAQTLNYVLVAIFFYIVGAGISNGIVDNLKNQLCSLRPFAALRPDDSDSYLSTPSGHVNMVVFTAVYVTYWINKEIEDPALKLL
eukprot:gene13738-29214_t